MEKYLSTSVRQTMEIASRFARGLKCGDVVLLFGDLGAGKTHFVKGLARGLGCDEEVTSPTFTLLNVYRGEKLEINHFDMYRLSGAEEAQALGFDEYFDSTILKGVTIVEWPENVDGLAKPPYIEVEINKTDKDEQREIIIRRKR